MDAHSELILEEYREHLDDFAIIQDVVMGQIRGYLAARGQLVTGCESRIKTEASLAGKLELKGYKYRSLKDITDIVGARIITFYNHEVDALASFIEETFTMDWDNSVDKRKALDVDRFGYMSLHYIASIPKSLYDDPAHPAVNEYRFEVQMRTTLQHAWAAIFHDTGYKSDVEIPREYIRGLNRLAGLLELADSEFDSIFEDIEEYRSKTSTKIANRLLDEVLIDAESLRLYAETAPAKPIFDRIEANAPVEIVSAKAGMYMRLLPVLRELELETLADLQDAIDRNGEMAALMVEDWVNSRMELEEGERLPVLDTAVIINLLELRIVDLGYGTGKIAWLYDKAERPTPRNRQRAEATERQIARLRERYGASKAETDAAGAQDDSE